ncbi:unnamed protein product [Aphanomyces euteiches]
MTTANPRSKLTLDSMWLRSPTKSPIKKAMQSASFNWENAAHQSKGQTTEETASQSPLRAELLDKVLHLLDQDDSVVGFVAELVDSVSALPLHDKTVRTAFLTQLHKAPQRTSGRTKCLNPQHCRAFILACANEIVELDENDPAFDYAESCVGSDDGKNSTLRHASMAAAADEGDSKVSSSSMKDVAAKLRDRMQLYDYESSVHPTICECERDECLHAAFERLHVHAQDMSKKRLVFTELKRQVATKSPAQDLASKYRTFEALKANRSDSPLNMGRKKRAFYKFKGPTTTSMASANVHHIDVHPPRRQPPFWTTPVAKDYLLGALVLGLAFLIYDELNLW